MLFRSIISSLLLLAAASAFARDGKTVDSLLDEFEQARGRARTEKANAIFSILAEEEITDSLMVFSPGVNADSLALQVYYWVGEQKMTENEFQQASAFFTKAAALANQGKNLTMISDSYAELAYSLTREGKFSQAVTACERAIEADTRLGDKDRLVISLNTMGIIYNMSRQSEEAEKYILRSLQMAKELNDTTKIALRYGTMSDIYMAQGRFDDALASAQEAFRLDSLSGNVPKMAIRRVQIAAPLFNKEEYDKAESLLLLAEPVLARTGNLASLGICENQLGDIACKRERWDEAAKHFNIAVNIYEHTGERLPKSRAYYGMYQALRHSDPAAAALQLEKYAYLNDSIYNENVSRMTAEFDARYRTAELESQGEFFRQRVWTWSILGLLLVIMLVFAFVIYQYKTKARIAEQKRQYELLSERFSSLSAEVLKNRVDGQTPADNGRDWLDKVDAILLEQMQKGNFSADLLAERLYMSSRSLSRKFNSTVGLSARDYMLNFRVDHACKLLGDSSKTISEVAHECGIEDVAYFSRFFKKMTGMTPTEYQKAHKVEKEQ